MASDEVLWKKVYDASEHEKARKEKAATAPRTPPDVSPEGEAPTARAKKTKPATTKPRQHSIEPPRDHATTTPSNHGGTTPTVIDAIRRAVNQLGKEVATHRFTQEEKRAIADVVYTYSQKGCKTTGNEIARIAINWLLSDYEQHSEESVLHKALTALNA
jgi:hypothetical protein